MITINCNTLEDTDRLASVLSSYVFEGFLILANGDLGAGKTRLAKAIAKELGVYDIVKRDGGWENVSAKKCGSVVAKAIEIANRSV